MGATGSTTVDFGAFPGKTDATVAITGQTAILSGSLVAAWIMPKATADHSIDEHWVDPPVVYAGNVSAGTGFTIYAIVPGYAVPPDAYVPADANNVTGGTLALQNRPRIDTMPRLYGLWTVAWCWN